jgi:hypothetical protein
MTTITVSVRDGTIVCVPKQGNVRVNPKGPITWKSHTAGQSFRLTFYLMPFEGMPGRQGDWPFEGAPPPTAPSTDWREEFSGTASDDGVFEYVVEMRDTDGSLLRLDPIIIIRS